MTRKAKLEKALAFDGTILPYKHFPMLVIGEDEQFALVNEYTKHGMKLASLAPLHAALVRAVEALEGMNDHVCDGGGDFPCSQMWFQDVATEALAKIDEFLDGFQPSPNCKPEREESGT